MKTKITNKTLLSAFGQSLKNNLKMKTEKEKNKLKIELERNENKVKQNVSA